MVCMVSTSCIPSPSGWQHSRVWIAKDTSSRPLCLGNIAKQFYKLPQQPLLYPKEKVGGGGSWKDLHSTETYGGGWKLPFCGWDRKEKLPDSCSSADLPPRALGGITGHSSKTWVRLPSSLLVRLPPWPCGTVQVHQVSTLAESFFYEIHLGLGFSWWEYLNYYFNFFPNCRFIQIFYFFSVRKKFFIVFGDQCLPRNLSISSKLSNLLAYH